MQCGMSVPLLMGHMMWALQHKAKGVGGGKEPLVEP